jgi:hypothetical protein
MYDEKNELEKRREIVKDSFKGFEQCIGKKFDELKIPEHTKYNVKWFLNDSRFPEDSLFWFGVYYMKDLYNL